MASKRKRTVLTVEDRVKSIRIGESGYKMKDIQNQLGVDIKLSFEALVLN